MGVGHGTKDLLWPSQTTSCREAVRWNRYLRTLRQNWHHLSEERIGLTSSARGYIEWGLKRGEMLLKALLWNSFLMFLFQDFFMLLFSFQFQTAFNRRYCIIQKLINFNSINFFRITKSLQSNTYKIKTILLYTYFDIFQSYNFN